MKKVIRIGSIKDRSRPVDVFFKIEITDGELSISGVIGPTRDGNAQGGCGQICMEFAHRNPAHNDRRYDHLIVPEDITFAPGWNKGMWWDLLEIWNDWHLNDMRAYCEHQKALGWRELASKEVTIYHWRLKTEFFSEKREIEGVAVESAKRGVVCKLTPHQLAVLNAEVRHGTHTPEAPSELYEPKKPLYNGDNGHEEKKLIGWLRPDEHPDGIMCKPCPVCGYKYGSEWKREELPEPVIKFLTALPDADISPAWV